MDDRDQRLKLLYDVARMHYIEGVTQTDISHCLKTSNTQVGRLLKEAAQEGLVHVDLVPPRLVRLQSELLSQFSCLKEVIVVAGGGNPEFNARMLGKAAADYFDYVIQRFYEEQTDPIGKEVPVKIGISGGNTIYEMIMALPERPRNITICPDALIGKGPFIPENKDGLVLITHLWEKSGRKEGMAYYVTLPPFEEGNPDDVRREYKRFLSRPKVKAVWNRMHETDIIFSSVGAVTVGEERMKTRGRNTLLSLLSDLGITEHRLKREGIVGEISYCMFDRDGNGSREWEWFITLGIDHFKHMATQHPKRRVIVIAGCNKEEVVKAVLKGRICNVLITDDSTAEYLLNAH